MRRLDEESTLRAVVEGTASETGTAFFRALSQNLARALDTHGAWVTAYDEDTERLRALAFWFGGTWIEDFQYAIAGTPCETAIKETRLVHIPDRILGLYPNAEPIRGAGVVSYLGAPLLSTERKVLGHVAVVDVRPMPAEKGLVPLFEIFANRALAEMRRLRLENDLRDRQEKLSRLIDSAMDAIVELDGDMRITLVNAATERTFREPAERLRGHGVERLLGGAATRKLETLAQELARRQGGERHLWIPDGLTAEPLGRNPFPAEATLSRFEMGGKPFYTLILRNIDDRVEAERTIRSLAAEAEYLRQEIEADHGFDEIIGTSPALRAALKGVAQVGPTDATVLILGETGTGKELFARAIHKRSARAAKPLIKVNCAAIPATLMESEFFGHERGAFTGATQRRDGRFALADGGTIFLDEIGELPLELQGKLLRVLQEGEFEPVGASRVRKVDVRVVAATNRDLERDVRDGTFREDLFYRLNVFPLRLPSLRERGDDVLVLAETMARKLARDLGKRVAPLSQADASALKSYAWPGNVRELRNVIERALITSPDGGLRLQETLPGAAEPAAGARRDVPAVPEEILTETQMRRVERDNMIAALHRAGWRIGGANGAAELLAVSPSTFKSRMKALAIVRPGKG
ncbi:MAG TPA: sigma 54-interacting transcriptional regulator [Candidatus Polarisedimenticolaceae bacterium]